MKGSIWVYSKSEGAIKYYFQVDGIKRGNFTKVIDPVFKGWTEIASGVNYKQATETLIFSKPFTSDDEMISWVKSMVTFPTTYNKCNAKCTVKVLVADKDEVKNVSKRTAKDPAPKSGTVRKSKKT